MKTDNNSRMDFVMMHDEEIQVTKALNSNLFKKALVSLARIRLGYSKKTIDKDIWTSLLGAHRDLWRD
uniref:Uncharacterized protein n=1 Tax=viral metagenome TaxID=1070528 RepID=A0A6M3K573_9ZZZZ